MWDTEGVIGNTTNITQTITIEITAEIFGGLRDMYKEVGIGNGPITVYTVYSDGWTA
jgi:hypothetical protein